MKYTKISQNYTRKKKRDYNLITPCCNRNNKGGKFENYNELPKQYGFCYRCGKPTLPPTLYKDESGNLYEWNNALQKYTHHTFAHNTKPLQFICKPKPKTPIKYIKEQYIWDAYAIEPENNLLQYLRKTYCKEDVERTKEYYCIGSTKDNGTIFWQININLKVQKNKISYYNKLGKRTNKFNAPYKNEDGYYSCLFGEHLITKNNINNKAIILVESEKTAIVGEILLSQYTWVAYGGISALTDPKIKVLKPYKVLIVPDMSENAVRIMKNKISKYHKLGYNLTLWDMTNGKTDEQLKNEGIYNSDLEDLFRKIKM